MDSFLTSFIFHMSISSIHSYWPTASNYGHNGPVQGGQYNPNYYAMNGQAPNYPVQNNQRICLCGSPDTCRMYNGIPYGRCVTNGLYGSCCQSPSALAYQRPSFKEQFSFVPRAAGTESVTMSSSSNSIETSTKHSKVVLGLLCGRQKRGYRRRGHEARVVGGQQALSEAHWPWMAVLFEVSSSKEKQKCGAVLISELYAVTAAHCLKNLKASQIKLLIGSDDVMNRDSAVKRHLKGVSSFRIHERYTPGAEVNDIALIKLSEPVEFAANILPICLPQGLGDLVNLTATVSGWGRVSENGPKSQHLQYTNMTIISNQRCVEEFEKGDRKEIIGSESLCTYQGNGNETDACYGDSGGPLVVKDGDQYALVGIVSWSYGCARPHMPAVFTNVTTYVDWIRKYI
ncbi:Serine proteinase stubble [Halotydeus destructor]|nr:Serine proteinase stubble [Halotydeus destructor]